MIPDPDEVVNPECENLQWRSAKKNCKLKKGAVPSRKYTKISEHARQFIAGDNQCSMFCGGKRCKYCTTDSWKPSQMAINGLYSEWVTDNIIAMARPSNYAIDKFNILDQFVEKNIKTVINLQQSGEHASCGHGNDRKTGFSYNPQKLMEMEIFYYNFQWRDYGVAPMSTIMDVVKVMQFALSTGRLAVHCHAGLGRTGLLIACYLVFGNREMAGDAIQYVRCRRRGAIQTSQQVQAVYDFERHLRPLRTVFPSKADGEHEVSFRHYLVRQNHVIHGFEARRLKHIPKVIYMCCERLLKLAGKGQSLSKVRLNVSSDSVSQFSVSKSSVSAMPPFVSVSTPQLLYQTQTQISVRSSVDYKSADGNVVKHTSVSLEDLANGQFKEVMGNDSGGAGVSSADPVTLDPLDVGCIALPLSRISLNHDKHVGIDNGDADCPAHMKHQTSTIIDPGGTHNSCLCELWNGLVEIKGKNLADEDLGYGQDSHLERTRSGVTCGECSMSDCSEFDAESSICDVSKEPLSVYSVESSPARQDATRKVTYLRARSKNVSSVINQPKSTPTKADSEVPRGETTTMPALHVPSISSSFLDLIGGHYASRESHSGRAVGEDEKRARSVCEALTSSECSTLVRRIADDYEITIKCMSPTYVKLNLMDSAWRLLAHEEDPHVVGTLLWDWLDQLREPVLRRQDTKILLEFSHSPRKQLHQLQKSVMVFMEYVASVMTKLFPQTAVLEMRLVTRLLSYLTHRVVSLDDQFSHVCQNLNHHWDVMPSNEAERLAKFFFCLIDSVTSAELS